MKFSRLFVFCLAMVLATMSVRAGQRDGTLAEPFTPRVNMKMSALAAIGIINPAAEFRLGQKWSMQLEGLGVMARKNFLGTGYPLQMGSFFLEGRYYFKKVYQGFFVAPNLGVGAFRLNKNILYKFFGWSPDLNYKKNENSIQTGSNLMGGVTLGYVHTFKSNPRWSVEINWSMGRQWAEYDDHLYDANGTPTGHVPMNGSAEYMPFYRGGIYLAYKW